jgi:hypothetical protein
MEQMIDLCISCQHGVHSGHTDVIEVAPPGLLGRRSCPCRGECVECVESAHDSSVGLLREWERLIRESGSGL